jgi:hypothetical protein
MKLFYSLLLLTFYNSTNLFAQNIFSEISRTVGLITFVTKSANTISYGTGTLLGKQVSKKDSLMEIRVYLITNKHVLPSFNENDFVHFKIRDDSSKTGFEEIVIQIFDTTNNHYVPNLKLDPDGNDLAIIDLTDFFTLHPKLVHILHGIMSVDFLATNEKLKQQSIDLGDDIEFVGFPSMLYDKRNISPLARSGIIATSPYSDYYFNDEYRVAFFQKYGEIITNKNCFLIDANAFGGTSGSLVITKPKFLKV